MAHSQNRNEIPIMITIDENEIRTKGIIKEMPIKLKPTPNVKKIPYTMQYK